MVLLPLRLIDLFCRSVTFRLVDGEDADKFENYMKSFELKDF